MRSTAEIDEQFRRVIRDRDAYRKGIDRKLAEVARLRTEHAALEQLLDELMDERLLSDQSAPDTDDSPQDGARW